MGAQIGPLGLENLNPMIFVQRTPVSIDLSNNKKSILAQKSHKITSGPTLLIRSSSFLQVTRTTIKSRLSFKFGRIRSRTVELRALERLKNQHRLIMGEILWPLSLGLDPVIRRIKSWVFIGIDSVCFFLLFL